MFHLEFAEQDGEPMCIKVAPPHVESRPINQYAQEVLKQAKEFSSAFLALVQKGDSASPIQPTSANGL